MRLKSFEIKGFKSISSIRLVDPNPFTVFVGANSTGKSNIFEALEFFNFCTFTDPDAAVRDFGGLASVFPASVSESQTSAIAFAFDLEHTVASVRLTISRGPSNRIFYPVDSNLPLHMNQDNILQENSAVYRSQSDLDHLLNFTRLFIGKNDLVKRKANDDSKLVIDGSNLEKVLKRVFKDENKKAEIIETLQAFIPGFERLEVVTDVRLDTLLVYEQEVSKALPRNLISDGTFNLISIITALYQSDTPQFLCIEEPENGLNPKVARELVTVIRNICNDHGHFVWLNSHSQSIVSELKPEELVLVDKRHGLTQVKQLKGENFHGLRMDEALLSNTLGGGVPW